MYSIKKILTLSFLFSSTALYSIDWQTMAVVSAVSSYLGCTYFEKKEHWHSKQFWKNVAVGASVSFISGHLLEWWCLSDADDNGKIDFTHVPDYSLLGDGADTGSLYSAISEPNTICGIRVEILNIMVPAVVSFIVLYLNHCFQEKEREMQHNAAEAQQNKEHRFQEEQLKKQQYRDHCFQERERRNAEKFAHQENIKNRAVTEESTTEQVIAEKLFMDQFRLDASKLKDRSSLGYLSDPLQKWLLDIDKGLFNHQLLLLSGYAGSGKSHSIRVVACEIKKQCEALGKTVHIFMVRQAKMSGLHKNETTKNIERFFSCIEKYAQQDSEVIILWDEIDVLTTMSLSDDSASHDVNSAVGVLKEIIDSHNLPSNVRILATTNHPDKINDAIKDRFTACCELQLPTKAEREALLRFWAKDVQAEQDKIWKTYAQKTNGWSLRDLQRFFKQAQKLSNSLFDKKSLKKSFEACIRAKKARKKDFSENLSMTERAKRGLVWCATSALGVVSNIAYTAHTLTNFVKSFVG